MPTILLSRYDPKLVGLSIALSIFASYAALNLANRISVSTGKTRAIWMSGGAIALGVGVWAMHYIGMLAFSLPVPVFYDLPTVGFSLAAAVFASGIAMFVVSRDTLRLQNLVLGSSIMGAGIFAMHYLGMAAMRLPAHCHYNTLIVGLSGLLAVIISGIALWITFRLQKTMEKQLRNTAVSAIVMGIGIAVVHYTGMAAVCFRSAPQFIPSSRHVVRISDLGIAGIVGSTFLVLLTSVLSSAADRYRKAQKELLWLTQTQYRLLMEHNLASVSRTAFDGSVREANDSFLRILGLESRDELKDFNMADHYWNPEDRTRIMAVLRQKGRVDGMEVCLRRKDQSPVWVIYNLALFPNLADGGTEVIATAMDISALKKTQMDLLAAKEQAEEANRAKSQFLANMSHELRTPLSGILGMTHLALEEDLPAGVRELLEDSRMSANALLNVVNDILDFSRFGAKKLHLEEQPVDLKRMFQEVLRTVAVLAEQKRIALAFSLAASVPEFVIGDAARLRQVVLNLLGNAIKFTEFGEVRLVVDSTEINQNRVNLHIAVSDTGIGIPPDRRRAIFDAFTQADISDTRRFGGTGLGLAICSQLVEAMGGSIEVESEVGKGSVFHVRMNVKALPSLKPFATNPVNAEQSPFPIRTGSFELVNQIS